MSTKNNNNNESEPVKNNEPKSVVYDWLDEIKNMPMSNMLKKGIISYIQRNNVKIKNKKEFEKTIEKIKKV